MVENQKRTMRYLSVCSGIEAATVAWHGLGWQPAAFSEIEPFPSAVLKHHYPTVPNVGDMTKFEEWNLESIDLLVGGTPCQSFSVAGLRKGLDDPRGNLMLTYGAIAKRFRPKWLVWENVPGVLSSNGGRDFGTFLGMLAELGYGFAYRVLDAQYFGVAQRRRRVFVVGCLGDWRLAAAVLFERDSLCGNPAPSREKGKGVAPGTQPSPAYGGSNPQCADTVTSKWAKGSGGPSGNEGGLFIAQPAVLMDQGGSVMEVRTDGTTGTLRRETHGHEPIVMQPVGVPEVMSTLLSSTAGVSRPGNEATEHETYIPMIQPITFSSVQSNQGVNAELGVSQTLEAKNPMAVAQPISIHPHCIGRAPDAGPQGKEYLTDGSAYCIDSRGQPQAVVQPVNIYGGNKRSDRPDGGFYVRMDEDTSKTLDATSGLNPTCSQGGTAVIQPMAFDTRNGMAPHGSMTGDVISPTLRAKEAEPPMVTQPIAFHPTQDQISSYNGSTHAMGCGSKQGTATVAVAMVNMQGSKGNAVAQEDGPSFTLNAMHGHDVHAVAAPTLTSANNPSRSPQSSEVTQQVGAVYEASMAVRRLTPRECERLQGFPDDHTLIPWRGKDASQCPDGPRYKALGNSMAVPVMAWIGQRIQAVHDLQK